MAGERSAEERKYWPFPVLPPEQRTDQHEREIRFLETAHHDGFRPYTSMSAVELGASNDSRGGLIVVRGRARWEVVLWTPQERVLSAFVDDFDCAAGAVLNWLRGQAAQTVLRGLEKHLVTLAGAARSFVLAQKGERVETVNTASKKAHH